MDVVIQLNLRPEAIHQLRDAHGIEAEISVYENLFDAAVGEVVEQLLARGLDPVAVRQALTRYHPADLLIRRTLV